jgi:hypothetical protein
MPARPIDRDALLNFANHGIVAFHNSRLARLENVSLTNILAKKNPYLFRAKNILTASDLVKAILDAFLSSSEEELFGGFLEELAIFVAGQTYGGRKSSAEGLDLEFDDPPSRYLVAIKSGPNWGNSSQWKQLEENSKRALAVQRQVKSEFQTRPVLGICYGKKRFADKGFYEIVIGQRFWHFLSGDPRLYLDIIEPIGHQARQHNENFASARASLENQFTAELLQDFCKPDYSLDWEKLVAFNSQNMHDA